MALASPLFDAQHNLKETTARAGSVHRPNLVKHGLPLYRYDDKLNVEEILHTQLTGVPPSQSLAVQW